ncbi:MAG TPA: hypothetical protein VKE74_05005 [Gemmataceae bacterium]|nr:hypothetical protein [Gemmataceae bacterium]
MSTRSSLRFVPSRVEGPPDVAEVVVHPDCLELLSAGRWVAVRFVEIADWPKPVWLRRALWRVGWKPRWLPVADRDWFHPPPDRFFRFYTEPPLVIFMPVDDPYPREESTFGRLQTVLAEGGFHTFDLG